MLGFHLDLDRIIYDEVLVNWPMKVLCKEDCAGICKKCGKNLNHGTCDCEKDRTRSKNGSYPRCI